MDGLVFGRYRTERKLGEGGMAEVWLAKHELIDQQAAVKLLQPQMSVNQEMVRRFIKEAQAAAAIKHPGIVKIYDAGYAESGRAYIVMELLRGEPLNERLRRQGQLPVDQTVRLMRQLAGVMDAAHQKRILHRDLKPENLFIVTDPEVQGGERIKVLDFGLAKLASEYAGSLVTSRGAIFGTPAYMAPEQCKDSGDVDGRVDLYSIGCIFYRCLCGRPPFVYKTALNLMRAQLTEQPVAPRQHRADIPVALDALIMRLLSKEPAARIQTCSELIHALDDAAIHGASAVDDTADTLIFAGGESRKNEPEPDEHEGTTDPDHGPERAGPVVAAHEERESDGIPMPIPTAAQIHDETERVAVPEGLLARPAEPSLDANTMDLGPQAPSAHVQTPHASHHVGHQRAGTGDPMMHQRAGTGDPMMHQRAGTGDPMMHQRAGTGDPMMHRAGTADPDPYHAADQVTLITRGRSASGGTTIWLWILALVGLAVIGALIAILR